MQSPRNRPKRPICPISLIKKSSFILLILALQRPVAAQSFSDTIAQAQQTLLEIQTLIDSIQERNSTGKPTTEWKSLFDGKSLANWKKTDFGGGGEVKVEQSFHSGPPAITVGMGDSLSGFNWTGGDLPRTRYEIYLEAMKIDGNDFVCGLTFPVGDSHASLILGGWGGAVVGISSIDNMDASENETTKYMEFPKNRWFKVRMRVTPDKLEAWLDDKKVIDQKITGRKISLRAGDIMRSIPLGISTYRTSAAYREIKLRRLGAE
jgi:hypothetical protein